MITRRTLSAFILWWAVCWALLVFLLIIYWWDLPRYVSWPLAVIEAIFAPDIKVLKQELFGMHAKKINSSFSKLFALLFLIHFLGMVLYAVYGAAYPGYVLSQKEPITVLGLNLWVAILSVPIVVATALLERTKSKPLSISVSKWITCIWVLLVLGLIASSFFITPIHFTSN